MNGKRCSKLQLASDAIHVEQEVICESVGAQDQIAVAYGGFNRIDFNRSGDFKVTPLIISSQRKKEFHSHLMLIYTGQSRIAAKIAKSQIDNISHNSTALGKIYKSVDLASDILLDDSLDIQQLGYLMSDMWELKKTLSGQVSNSLIDDLYVQAKSHGAIGGKILGAGGGGFMLLFVPPDKRESVKHSLGDYLEVPFRFEEEGSTVTIYQPTEIF